MPHHTDATSVGITVLGITHRAVITAAVSMASIATTITESEQEK
jgi:hypothetical protein